jgi:uncharacterized protein
MEFITVIGYGLVFVMGGLLGLLGGGGSILTIPILVYFFGISPLLSTGYSLFIVGASSSVAVYNYWKERLINVKVGIVFGVPATGGVLVSRILILPNLPETIHLLNIDVSKDRLILLIFAILVLAISIFMIKSRDATSDTILQKKENGLSVIKTLLGGSVLGVITGFVGAGGGFMIVPALIILTPVTLKESIATSLFIISVKAIVGFMGDLSAGVQFDWVFLCQLLSITVIGIIIGTKINKYMPVQYLRKGFGYFVFAMGIFILYKELC